MQRTALCAREIGAFLKVRIARPPYRSIGAPPLMPNPFGTRGNVIAIPLLDLDAANRDSGRRVVPPLACQCPWCSVWYAGALCGLPVVPAWYERPLCGLLVVPSVIVYCAWFQPNTRRADVILCCG